MVPSNLPVRLMLLLLLLPLLLLQSQGSLESDANSHDFPIDGDLEDYGSPERQAQLPLLPPPKFGHDLWKEQFLLNYTNFNHGSFGACPRFVLDYQTSLRTQQEEQPDPFLRNTFRNLWNVTRHRVAVESLRLHDPQTQKGLVLVESASTAVNGILRGMVWESGDMILYFSTAYGMVKNTAQWLHIQYGVQIIEVPITFPILVRGGNAHGGDANKKDDDYNSNEDVFNDADAAYLDPLRTVLEELERNCSCLKYKLKVAVLDHMVSIPAIRLPVEKMTKMIRNYTTPFAAATSSSSGRGETLRPALSSGHNNSGTFILIDGAHAWGQIPSAEISSLLNQGDDDHSSWIGDGATRHCVDEVDDVTKGERSGCATRGIDAYLSNGHKWMYSPKGSAFLWVRPSRISNLFPEPTVISSENSITTTSTMSTRRMIAGTTTNNDANDDPMAHRFVYTSTKDYTAILSLSKALDFQHWLGGEDSIHQYVRDLAIQAKKYLINLWGTFGLVPDSMELYMINVVLPIDRNDEQDEAIRVATALQRWLYDEHNMYVVIAREGSSGYFYTRLSAQVYLEMIDFERLGEAVLAYLSREERTDAGDSEYNVAGSVQS